MPSRHSPSPPSSSLAHRLRRAKGALLAVSLTLAGLLLMMLGQWIKQVELGTWAWLAAIPVADIGSTLLVAGMVGTIFDMALRRDQEETVKDQFRQIIHDEAPAMRDAVIEGFRFNTDDLERIATPRLLDELAVNSLGMRFGDAAFGREVYGDIKHQAITAEERWYDARVDATLGIPRVRSVAPNPFFDLLVRWEYTVVPKHRFRKFAVVSDRQRYDQMVAERGEASVWFRRPVPGLEVTDPAAFALEQFTINGEAIPFTRQADDVSQVYIVDLGEQVVRDEKPVVVSFAFRTLVPRDGHVVHIDIDRPTKGLEVELTYDAAAIRRVRLMDFASRGDGGRIITESEIPVVRYRYDGWLFPRAGLVFAWTLAGEDPATKPQAADEDPAASARITTEASHPDAPRHSVPAARTSPAHKDDEHAASKIKRDARHRRAMYSGRLVRSGRVLRGHSGLLSRHPWWSPSVGRPNRIHRHRTYRLWILRLWATGISRCPILRGSRPCRP